jgi:ribose 1,5-bisphosphokinase PhnN
VDVPRRFVTRPARPDDTDSEHVSPEELDRRVAAGEIAFHWRRELEPGRVERYGFAPPPAGALAVYSANDALVAAGVQPGWIIVAVRAPLEVRRARLARRAWSPTPGELERRLAETPGEILALAAHVIENHGVQEEAAPAILVDLVRRYLK